VRASVPGATEINARLREIVAMAEAALLDPAPLPEIARKLKAQLGLLHQERDLIALLDAWIESKRPRLRPNTLKVLRRLRLHLEAFAGGRTVADVGPSFLADFQRHLIEQDQSPKTINRTVRHARAFLRWLQKEGLIETIPDVEPLPEGHREPIFLTPQELAALARADLSDMPQGARDAREVFLFMAFTGVRISDARQLMRPNGWDQVNLEEGVWHLLETKTGRWLRWPLIPQAVRILRKRLEAGAPTPLPKITEQAINRRIKEAAARAGITAQVRLPDGRCLPKCEALTTHAARRTFISTVAAAAGVAPLLRLTHTDLGTLEAYVGAGDEHRRRAIEAAFNKLDL
jgi:integrase